MRIIDGSRTEIQQRKLNETASMWKRRMRLEVELMLDRTPQESHNEGAGLLIEELIDDE